jgi:tetratricopeptide (TPR) repeat protein
VISRLWLRSVLAGEILFALVWLAWMRDPDRVIDAAPAIRAGGLAFLGWLGILGVVTLATSRRTGALARFYDAIVRVQDPELRAAATRVAANSNSAVDQAAYGRLLFERRRTVEAAERFARAVELDPSMADARYRLGLCLAAEGFPTEAAAHIGDAVASDAQLDGGRARLRLAEALLRSGRAEAAEGLLRALAEASPGWPATHYLRAMALEEMGRDREAAAEADLCLETLRALGRPLGPEEQSMRDGAMRLLAGGGPEADGGARP